MDGKDHSFDCLCGKELLVQPIWRGKLYRCTLCRKFAVIPIEAREAATAPVFICASERLVIRLAEKKDIAAIHAIHSDPLNYDFEVTEPADLRRVKKELRETQFPRGFARSNTLHFLVENKRNEEVLGTFRVQYTQPYHSAMIGFMFAQEHQGKGFASESLAELSQLFFNSLGLEKLSALCDAKNLACQAVLEKAGFEREGFLRKFFHHPVRGWLDAPSYALFPKGSADPAEEPDAPGS